MVVQRVCKDSAVRIALIAENPRRLSSGSFRLLGYDDWDSTLPSLSPDRAKRRELRTTIAHAGLRLRALMGV